MVFSRGCTLLPETVLMALGGNALIKSTQVGTIQEQVKLHFGTPREASLAMLTTTDLKRYLGEGHFASGSMTEGQGRDPLS